jgi:hypothetical protein
MNVLGIYKIPSKWNKTFTYDKNHIFNYEIIEYQCNFNESDNRITSLKDNIYLNMFKELVKKLNVKNSDYIFVDESLNKSKKLLLDNINIWILKDLNDLLSFKSYNIYFIRGNYLNFYNSFIPVKSKIIFYSATSLNFDYYDKNSKKKLQFKDKIKNENLIKKYKFIDHPFYNRIEIALIHENKIYKDIFKSSKCVVFNKFSSNEFYHINLNRCYDFVFIAEGTQTTKNHESIFEFISFLDLNKLKLNILYISNEEYLKLNVHNFIDKSKLKYVNVIFKHNIPPKELNILLNQTKIHLLFSGRDACPRTISETLSSGCYNIALSTLSDGISYFNNKKIGTLIDSKKSELILGKSKSLRYTNCNLIWSKIVDIYNENNFDYKYISEYSKKLYTLENIVNKIIKNNFKM